MDDENKSSDISKRVKQVMENFENADKAMVNICGHHFKYFVEKASKDKRFEYETALGNRIADSIGDLDRDYYTIGSEAFRWIKKDSVGIAMIYALTGKTLDQLLDMIPVHKEYYDSLK